MNACHRLFSILLEAWRSYICHSNVYRRYSMEVYVHVGALLLSALTLAHPPSFLPPGLPFCSPHFLLLRLCSIAPPNSFSPLSFRCCLLLSLVPSPRLPSPPLFLCSPLPFFPPLSPSTPHSLPLPFQACSPSSPLWSLTLPATGTPPTRCTCGCAVRACSHDIPRPC